MTALTHQSERSLDTLGRRRQRFILFGPTSGQATSAMFKRVRKAKRRIVTRLVALNAERHAEEKAGTVRWLRPDYQIPRAGVTVLAPKAQGEQIEALLPAAATKKPAFPRDAIGQTAAVLADLRGGAGLTSAEIARRYAQGLRSEPRIAATLAALVRLGHVSAEGDRYTLRRAA